MELKYFNTDGITKEQYEALELIDTYWQSQEQDDNYHFIHKDDIKVQKGMDKFIWEHIKDTIPVMYNHNDVTTSEDVTGDVK